MPNPVLGIVGAVSSVAGGLSKGKAAKNASNAEIQAAQLAIDEQRAAREQMRALLEPYVAAGGPALQAQMAALGLAGPEAQAAFVRQQEQSPFFQALARQGEESILQNASATGGLRGGNTQGALAQFRPAMLNQFLENQYAKLGGMTQLGQNSAAGVGSAGLGVANQISRLLQDQGSARAGGILGQAQASGGMISDISGLIGRAFGGGF